MSDRAIVIVAIAIAAGTLAARDVASAPAPAVAAAAALVLALRAPALVVALAAMCAASALAAASLAGLDLGRDAGRRIDGWATIVADPIEVPGGVRADVRLDGNGKRVRVTARDAAAGALRQRLAGERVRLRGRLSPLGAETAGRLAWRHLAGRLDINEIRDSNPGAPPARLANGIRRLLVGGATSLPADERALFTGVVLGDDRAQDPADVEDFRAAGLTHLLAVSGQNVAFTMALAAPLFTRLGLRTRLVAAMALLALFGTATRWEPSVVRVVAMAAVAVSATTLGRPTSSLRALAIAVSASLLVDPLLVRSLGFRLSVGACTGIVCIGPRLRRRWPRMPTALAITLSAQAGVAPFLLPAFGGIPLVSVPANLLAVPVAAPLMGWGIVAGVPAGLVGGQSTIATALHLPTRGLVWWLAGVARVAANLPLGTVTAGILAIAAAAGLGCALVRTRAGPPAAVVVAVAAALGPACFPAAAAGERLDTGGDDRLWLHARSAVVVTDGRAPPGRLLAALRRRGVTALDAIVVTRGTGSAGRSVSPVLTRLRPRVAIVPPGRAWGADGAPTRHGPAWARDRHESVDGGRHGRPAFGTRTDSVPPCAWHWDPRRSTCRAAPS